MKEIKHLLAKISYLQRVGVDHPDLERVRQRLVAHMTSGQDEPCLDWARQALADARQAALDAGVPEADFGGGPDDLSTGLIALDHALSPDGPPSDDHVD